MDKEAIKKLGHAIHEIAERWRRWQDARTERLRYTRLHDPHHHNQQFGSIGAYIEYLVRGEKYMADREAVYARCPELLDHLDCVVAKHRDLFPDQIWFRDGDLGIRVPWNEPLQVKLWSDVLDDVHK